MSLVLACLLAVIPAKSACAEGLAMIEQIWLQTPTQFRVSEKVKLLTDVSPRMADDGVMNQFLIRTGLQFQVRKCLSVAQGFDTADNFVPSRNHENRLWQQVQLQRNHRKLQLSARFRLEERFFQDKPGTSLRPRFMLRASHRIGKSKFSFVTSDELFLTLNNMKDGPAAGVDRNRLTVGMAYAVDRNRTIEAGYRVEYINKTDVDDEKRRQLVVQLASNF